MRTEPPSPAADIETWADFIMQRLPPLKGQETDGAQNPDEIADAVFAQITKSSKKNPGADGHPATAFLDRVFRRLAQAMPLDDPDTDLDRTTHQGRIDHQPTAR